MKSAPFFSLLVSISLLAAGAGRVMACGPYPPIIPTPEFFVLKNAKTISDYEKDENLRLWQAQTSDRIPLADIEEAVYRSTSDDIFNFLGYDSNRSSNLFFMYIQNTNDEEVVDFLCTAKNMEEAWGRLRTPWYYPRSRREGDSDFSHIIDRCRSYRGTRLGDRYGLQGVRALFASRAYDECIQYYDSVFTTVPDDNLLKRMARRYVAGCWSRLGDDERADSVFAVAGDIRSLSAENPAAYMARHNPTAPQLLEYARTEATDSAQLARLVPVAEALIANPKVKHKGDWEYLLSYFYRQFARDGKKSSKYLSRALTHTFADAELRDQARAYNMKSADYGLSSAQMLADLRWLEGKCDVLSPDYDEWIRRAQNIVYVDWVPRLWKRQDYANAILVCAFADYLDVSGELQTVHDEGWYLYPSQSDAMANLRKSQKSENPFDYRTLSFQMMGSLSSAQLAQVYAYMRQPGALQNFVRRKIRTDADYYNELIGTLALREENYARAVTYLSKVSPGYQRTMNIYKGNYLNRNPFATFPTRWSTTDWGYDSESSSGTHRTAPKDNAKLNFARRMVQYQRDITHAHTADRRGMARLMYAIGRRNSFEECWALTQYWRGEYVGLFEPNLDYWHDDFDERHYNFLYDYEKTVGHKYTEGLYEKEVKAALAMMQSPQVRAEAEYLLGNLSTVVRLYPETPTALHIRTSCDTWQQWL